MKKPFFLILMIILSNISFSQTKMSFGLDYSYNYTSNKLSGRSGTPFSMIGMTFELKKSKWVGFETGLLYRLYKDELVTGFDPSYFSQEVRQEYISIPILYKVSTKVLNVSIGTTIDYCFGVQSFLGDYSYPKGKTPYYYVLPYNQIVEYHNPYQNFYFGLVGKLSKEIQLNNRLNFEPQLRYSQNFSNNNNYHGLGFGCSVKYKL